MATTRTARGEGRGGGWPDSFGARRPRPGYLVSCTALTRRFMSGVTMNLS